MQLHFDPTISLGTVISAGLILIGLFRLIGKVSNIELKVDVMWAAWVDRRETDLDYRKIIEVKK